MALKTKITPKLTYRLRLSPQMRLSLNLLQLPLVKLKEYMRREIEENPLLELSKSESQLDKKQTEDFTTVTDEEQQMPQTARAEEAEEKKRYKESLITKPTTLAEHVLEQLILLVDTDEEIKIGKIIAGNLNDNGYLTVSIEEIAEFLKTRPSNVEKVLFLIQTLDPPGVGARDLKECLLLQLKAEGKQNSLAAKLVKDYLPYLRNKNFAHLNKKLKVSAQEIKEAVKKITNLEPKPGRSFDTERAIYIIPDVILNKRKKAYDITLNNSELPSITLNNKYKRMIQQRDTPKDVKNYLKKRLQAAHSLIEAINRRHETIKKITVEIISIQKDFLEKGVNHLKPMTLSQIANKIDKNKSTVSRAMANKYIQTPQGIFKLHYFLSSGIKQENGKILPSELIKAKIKNIIKTEGRKKPLSDTKITGRLKKKGISVSRRTVNKYRNQLKISPSADRKFIQRKKRKS